MEIRPVLTRNHAPRDCCLPDVMKTGIILERQGSNLAGKTAPEGDGLFRSTQFTWSRLSWEKQPFSAGVWCLVRIVRQRGASAVSDANPEPKEPADRVSRRPTRVGFSSTLAPSPSSHGALHSGCDGFLASGEHPLNRTRSSNVSVLSEKSGHIAGQQKAPSFRTGL